MENLLRTALLRHYGINRNVITVLRETSCKEYFDLSDKTSTMIVNHTEGLASYRNQNRNDISVLNFEKFINQFDDIAFGIGRKRCDFILFKERTDTDNIFILNELTTSVSIESLSKPIYDKAGTVIFPEGKFQKAEIQLAVSLQTLLDVPEIKDYADACTKKVCLLSYRIDNGNDPSGSRKAFNRYKAIESKETGSEGAMLHQEVIESLGFEYRRISHEYSYAL